MGIGADLWQVVRKVEVNADLSHAQIVIAQSQGIFQNRVHANRHALWLVLPGKTQKILHDTVSTLRLLVYLFGVSDGQRSDLTTGGQQLAISQNRREGVVQLMRHARDQ